MGLIITASSKGSEPSVWNAVMGLSFFACFICGIMLLLEGPSFATSIKEREDYFDKMKYAIQNTSSYSAYVSSFHKDDVVSFADRKW